MTLPMSCDDTIRAAGFETKLIDPGCGKREVIKDGVSLGPMRASDAWAMLRLIESGQLENSVDVILVAIEDGEI